MARQIYVTVQGQSLVPIDAGQAAEVDRLKLGKIYRLEVKEDRSTPMHRMFMSLCSLVARAFNHGNIGGNDWDTHEIKEMAKLLTGRHKIVPAPKILREKYPQRIWAIPKSMSFSKMSNDEALAMTNEFMGYVAEDVAPWVADAPEYLDICQIVGKINDEEYGR